MFDRKVILKEVGLSDADWIQALHGRQFSEESFDGATVVRVHKPFKGIERGTVFTNQGVIYEYPSIQRIFHLENGLRRNLQQQPFFAEEKIDGYNVRVARVDGQLLAFTRGGFVCPFTTDRLPDLLPADAIFDDHPELVLCGEVAGPGNPYNLEASVRARTDVAFFLFDFLRFNEREPLPPEARYRLADRYGLPQVPRFGAFSVGDVERLKKLVERLNDEGAEGLVLKQRQPGRKGYHKYQTLRSCLRDIELTSGLMLELPGDYYSRRLVQAAFYQKEFGPAVHRDICRQIGQAIFQPLAETLDRVEAEGVVSERFRIKFRRHQNVDRLVAHLRRVHVESKIVERRKEGDYWVVEFAKIYRSSTDRLHERLLGRSFID